MADITPRAGIRVLDTPERPLRIWFRDDSPDYVPGQTLQVILDGPDEGRAFGLIQPPPHGSAYTPGAMGRSHRHYGRRPPNALEYPDNFAVFHRGPIEVTNPDGSTGKINVGRLTIHGGHSQDAVGASTFDEAVEFLNREGRYSHRFDEVGMIGVASACNEPGFEGAVMFRGCALPGMNTREAMLVNSTSVSAEVWPCPAYGDKYVFAGAVRVDHTAWPYLAPPLALAAGTTDCVGPSCVIYGDCAECQDDIEEPTVPVDEPVAAAVAAPAPTAGIAPTAAQDITQSPPAAAPAPVADPAPAAAPQIIMVPAAQDGPPSAEIEELREDLTNLAEQVGRIEVEVSELAVHIYGGENSGALNELEGFSDRIGRLESLIDQMVNERSAPQPDVPPDGQMPRSY